MESSYPSDLSLQIFSGGGGQILTKGESGPEGPGFYPRWVDKKLSSIEDRLIRSHSRYRPGSGLKHVKPTALCRLSHLDAVFADPWGEEEGEHLIPVPHYRPIGQSSPLFSGERDRWNAP
jgi:hypothetical protein